jgi:hypothetical protein
MVAVTAQTTIANISMFGLRIGGLTRASCVRRVIAARITEVLANGILMALPDERLTLTAHVLSNLGGCAGKEPRSRSDQSAPIEPLMIADTAKSPLQILTYAF